MALLSYSTAIPSVNVVYSPDIRFQYPVFTFNTNIRQLVLNCSSKLAVIDNAILHNVNSSRIVSNLKIQGMSLFSIIIRFPFSLHLYMNLLHM